MPVSNHLFVPLGQLSFVPLLRPAWCSIHFFVEINDNYHAQPISLALRSPILSQAVMALDLSSG